jgi:5S rRNA maturation endonuclease (ribonuclease M5)
MKITEFLRNFQNVKKTVNGFVALCPSHDDKRQSLTLREGDGKILVNCFAGCDVQTIVSDLGLTMRDLFEESKGFQSNSSKRRIVEIYKYTDENGKTLYENVKFEPKDFRQRHFDKTSNEIWNLNGVRRVSYRLPELIKAVNEDTDIWLCEGEKDVENLRSLGFTASSFKNWKREFNAFIKGAHVCLLIDHDKAGIKLANDAAKELSGAVASIKSIDLFKDEPLPEKHGKDFSDWFENELQNGSEKSELAEKICLVAGYADHWQSSNDELKADLNDSEDFISTELKPFPKPTEKCFYGLAGQFVLMVEQKTEADPMALLVQFLTYFGNIIGHTAYYQVEADKHFTNIFCVLVGDTASGRKGTSFGRVKEVFKGEDLEHEKNCLVSGLASGEGLLWQIRDAVWEEKTNKKSNKLESICTDAGVSDKRLLVVEGEFAQVLRVQGREGNTLSAFLRNLWDNGTARNLTKNSPLRTTEAHVSIIGHITKTELLSCLDEVESANGYANRFLWVAVRRSKFLPFGSPEIDFDELAEFERKLSERIKYSKTVQRMIFNFEARMYFASEYQRLETSRFGFLAKVTQRASAYVCRLSCIFALLDGKDEIDCNHLEAAFAVWQFSEDSARYIFGERIGDKNADLILAALRDAENGLSRTGLRDLFDRHLSKSKLDSALQTLLENGLVKCESQETKGRSREIWFACDLCDKSDKSFERISEDQLLVAFVAKSADEEKISKFELCPECQTELSTTANGDLLCEVCLYMKP